MAKQYKVMSKQKNKSIEEIGYFLYVGRYFLYMYQNEFNFVKDEIMNPNISRANKMIIDKIKAYDEQLISRGVNTSQVFKEFKEEKVNAIHNTMAMMLNLNNEQCLLIESTVEELMQKFNDQSQQQ